MKKKLLFILVTLFVNSYAAPKLVLPDQSVFEINNFEEDEKGQLVEKLEALIKAINEKRINKNEALSNLESLKQKSTVISISLWRRIDSIQKKLTDSNNR